jgi:hypothetical protein
VCSSDLDKPESQKLLKDLEDMTENLAPKSKEVMTPEQKAAFPDLSSRQEKLGESTNRLEDKLEMLAQLFPGMDTEILQDIQGATGSMENASKELQEEDAGGSIPPEQEALKGLTRSQQAMKKMGQQMAPQMPPEQGGTPSSQDPRITLPYGLSEPFPTLPGLESNRPQMRGYTGIDREEFQTPSKDAYQVPKIFREKIMESLKEKIPPQYRQKVEKYFQGLTE